MNWYIVTVRGEKDPEHDPKAKRTGECEVSPECTDVTGEHHSLLMEATSADAARALLLSSRYEHVTRVERVPDDAVDRLSQKAWARVRRNGYVNIEIRRDKSPSLVLCTEDVHGVPWVAYPDQVDSSTLRGVTDNRTLRLALALLEQARATVQAALDMPEGM